MMAIVFALLDALSEEEKSLKYTTVVIFRVGIHCQNCIDRIQKNIPFEKGVKDLKVDMENKEVTVIFNSQKTTVDELINAFNVLGYTCGVKNKE